ncbi:hypothetical protein [Virgibacillus sp. YIM 98842]|uniref:hypothetical protein n=1 Tax=Virgibacillus sp. YIM 98842 TaxID=2663533 RepID=UPI0013DADC65|nr:hypothetical protein [Virgibacillus sp. YIM 98842]
MSEFTLLIIIGIIAGIGLSLFMELVRILTGNPASILLYNLDYMPVLKKWSHIRGMGLAFHFVTCIASVVVLFYLLRLMSWEHYIFPYVIVYTAGSALLFFLSALTKTPPKSTDGYAWLHWTAGHGVFGIIVGVLVRLWVQSG